VGRGVPQVPLGQIATIRQVAGPMVVRTEDAQMTVPPGYTMVWSGQFEYMERAKAKMQVVVPATLAIVFLLLFFSFRNVGETLIVMLSIPFTLVGGVWFLWALDYNWSVAVTIGFLALAGVAAETSVIMLVYLDQSWAERKARAGRLDALDVLGAAMDGAVERVRPKMMTVASTMLGLLPILWGAGTGASVMKRIAAPMIGGMVSSTVLTLLVVPAIWTIVKEHELARGVGLTGARGMRTLAPSSVGRTIDGSGVMSRPT
jgi:Cu(I)/Ag(I) efflux system membrane protein CusA/SilA